MPLGQPTDPSLRAVSKATIPECEPTERVPGSLQTSLSPISNHPRPQEASPTEAEQHAPASREGLFSATARALDETVITSGVQKPTAAHLTLPESVPL